MPPGDILRGQTALVTGGGQRLGAAIALTLAEAGVNIALHYHRSGAAAEDVAEQIRGMGVDAWCFPADLGASAGLPAFFEDLRSETGPVHFLVNNASIFDEDSLRDLTLEALEEKVRVNALAPAILGRAFAAGEGACAMVNLLDTMIQDYDKKHVSYHLSKRMLATLTRMMAMDFAPGLRVNAVAPGLILAPVGAEPGYLERLAHSNPLQRHGDPEDVTKAVLFLLRSPFVTGQCIFVDGGRHLRGSMYG